MRRLLLLVYALVFVTELGQAAIVPLLPTFTRELGLSEVETGALLAAATFATLVCAAPLGIATDRFGPRRLAVAAAGLLVVSALVQAGAGSFWELLAGRALFGVAFATVWTAGLALVAGATSSRRAAALGATITVGGLAHLVGPTSAGLLAERLGVWAPFVVIAVLAALVTALLATAPSVAAVAEKRQPLREAVGAARRHREIRSALVTIGLLGIVAGIVPLLVPLILDDNGLSAGQIGVVFSAGAGVWIVASAFVARLGARAARVPAAAIGIVGLGLALLLPVATLATVGVAVFLLLRAATHAPLSTISYPLAEIGAGAAGIGRGTAIGLMNVVWAGAAATSPIVGGALADALGAQATFALVALLCGAVGAWMLRGEVDRRERRWLEAQEAAGLG